MTMRRDIHVISYARCLSNNYDKLFSREEKLHKQRQKAYFKTYGRIVKASMRQYSRIVENIVRQSPLNAAVGEVYVKSSSNSTKLLI